MQGDGGRIRRRIGEQRQAGQVEESRNPPRELAGGIEAGNADGGARSADAGSSRKERRDERLVSVRGFAEVVAAGEGGFEVQGRGRAGVVAAERVLHTAVGAGDEQGQKAGIRTGGVR